MADSGSASPLHDEILSIAAEAVGETSIVEATVSEGEQQITAEARARKEDGPDRNTFQTRCSLSYYIRCMKVVKPLLRSHHLRLMKQTPFYPFVACQEVHYPICFIVQIIARYRRNGNFQIGPCTLHFSASDLAVVLGIPNEGSPLDLRCDGTKAHLRDILGKPLTMERSRIYSKLCEYVKKESRLSVEISVKLWIALLCSCFFLPMSGTAGPLSVLPYLDDIAEIKTFNWAEAIYQHLMASIEQIHEQVKDALAGGTKAKTIYMHGCLPALGVSTTNFLKVVVCVC